VLHVELVQQEACDFVAIIVDFLALWVFVAERNMRLDYGVAVDVNLLAIVIDSFDRRLVPDAVIVTAIKLVTRLKLVTTQFN